MSDSAIFWASFFMLRVPRCIAPDVVPRCLGADEDVLFDCNARVTIDGAERDAVYDSIMNAAQRSAAPAAELKAPRFVCGKGREQFFALNP